MKSRWIRAVKNHCKASKIHSSGDKRPGHRTGKVHRSDGHVSGVILIIMNEETLVNSVRMLFAGVFVL